MSAFEEARARRAAEAQAKAQAYRHEEQRNVARAQAFKADLDGDLAKNARHLTSSIDRDTITVRATNGDWVRIRSIGSDNFFVDDSGIETLGGHGQLIGEVSSEDAVDLVLGWVEIHPA